MQGRTRRTFLRRTGFVTAVGLMGYAGSENGGGDGESDATIPGEEYPAIDEWLTETQAGPATDNYDGTLTDWRDRDVVTVEVGAAGNGDGFAFGPPGIVVSTGTTVEWSWTGQGNPHNVEAEPEEQIGESDYEFSSGEPVGGSGVMFTFTMDQPGIANYHCEPHLSLGMKGGIGVE